VKKIQNCSNSTVLVAFLVAGIFMVMGAYRIFSYLCELPTMAALGPILLAVGSAALSICGVLIARAAFLRLQELRDEGEL